MLKISQHAYMFLFDNGKYECDRNEFEFSFENKKKKKKKKKKNFC